MSTSLEAIAPPRVAELIAEEEARFREKRGRSHELWEQARRLIPRGVPSSFQDAAPQPVFVDHGKGSRVWDVDGNEYVDYVGGHGSLLLGHNHPQVMKAATRQLALGTHFGACHEPEVRWAEMVCKLVPSAQRASTRQGSSSKTAVASRANIAVPCLSVVR